MKHVHTAMFIHLAHAHVLAQHAQHAQHETKPEPTRLCQGRKSQTGLKCNRLACQSRGTVFLWYSSMALPNEAGEGGFLADVQLHIPAQPLAYSG